MAVAAIAAQTTQPGQSYLLESIWWAYNGDCPFEDVGIVYQAGRKTIYWILGEFCKVARRTAFHTHAARLRDI